MGCPEPVRCPVVCRPVILILGECFSNNIPLSLNNNSLAAAIFFISSRGR